MSKADRKRAMQAEIERRANQSGVPPERYVYEMNRHHGDEGGPRTFVPVRMVQMLDSGEHDSALWPSLFVAAIEQGVPIELAPDDSRMFRDGRTPLADLCSWGDAEDELLILTERANEALEPMFRAACRVVPVSCGTHRLFGYHLDAVKDVLDVPNCEADWMALGGRQVFVFMEEYALHTDRLGPEQIFCVPQNLDQLLVLQPFVDLVLQHSLTGYRFERVWPHSSIRNKIEIEVKKLPPKTKGRTWPTYSVEAEMTPTDSLDAALGSPLTNENGKPVDVVTCRLPDLSCPTGAIVAADLLFTEGRPFVRRVPAGAYPLFLVAARTTKKEERIALAILRFSYRPVARWEVAKVEQPKSKSRCKSASEGYGVDSGTGGFCDASAQDALLELADPERSFEDRVLKEMKKSYRHTRSWVHLQTPKGSAAIFTSGYGDGTYQSYFGLDERGEPVMLLTDFGVVDWERNPK